MKTLTVLILVTLCYAAYNLLVKVSTSHVTSLQTPPILATICLQATALLVSLGYLIYLSRQSVSVALPTRAWLWAAGAGLCIGIAEVLYFYLFRGFENEKQISASTAIPFIVGGTIVVAVTLSWVLFRETLTRGQWAGVGFSLLGMIMLAVNSGQ